MTEAMGSDQKKSKRPRLDQAEAAATHADGAAAAAAAADVASPHALVAVPVIGDQTGANELLPALQQLLSVYQVEYWALLEELRAKHNSMPSEHTESAADGSKPEQAAAAATAGAGGSVGMQQLWQAAVAAGDKKEPAAAAGQQGRDAPAAASQPSPAEDKGQQADTTSSLASAFAAASHPYGDLRCGFAADAPEQQQQQQEPVQQLSLPSLQQAEQLLLRQLPRGGQDGGAADAQQLQEWRQRWSAVAPSVAGLEQLASATSMQYMDAQGGLACLCGQQGRWVLRRSAASLGRSTDSSGEVDIDLGKAAGDAGVGSKVSCLQAQLLLTADGRWSITNTGRAQLAVNGQQVPRGSTVALPHLSFLEVSSLPLLFMVNSMAVQRAVARSVHLAM